MKLYSSYLALCLLVGVIYKIFTTDLLQSFLPTVVIFGTVVIAPWIIILTCLTRDLRDEERAENSDR